MMIATILQQTYRIEHCCIVNFDPLSGIDEKQKEIMANYEFVMNAAGSVLLWATECAPVTSILNFIYYPVN